MSRRLLAVQTIPDPTPPAPLYLTWYDQLGISITAPEPGDVARLKTYGAWARAGFEECWNLADLAAFITEAHNQDLKVLVCVQPCEGSRYAGWNPARYQTFANWAKQVADLGPDAIEAGNELNLDIFNEGDLNACATTAATLARTVATTVHTTHPNTPIITCGWSPRGGAPSVQLPQNALDDMLDADATLENVVAGYGYHPYEMSHLPTTQETDHSYNAAYWIKDAWSSIVAKGASRPMWLTEFGYAGTDTNQVTWMNDYFSSFAMHLGAGTKLGPVFWHTLYEGQSTTSEAERTLGILRETFDGSGVWNEKPAAARLRSIGAERIWYTPANYLVATGTTADQTTGLNTFLAKVPDHQKIKLLSTATYRTEGTWLFASRHDIEINGQNATLQSFTDGNPVGRRHIKTQGSSSDLDFHHIIIYGNNADGNYHGATTEAQHGFDIADPVGAIQQRITVTSCIVHQIYGDGIYSAYNDGAEYVNNTIYLCGRQGLGIVGGDGISVQGNYLDAIGRSLIDFEPLGNGQPSTANRRVINVEIAYNTLKGAQLGAIAAHGGGKVDSVWVHHNTLTGKPLNILCFDETNLPANGGFPGRRADWLVENNTSDTAAGAAADPNDPTRPPGAMKFTHVDGVIVRNNVQPIQVRSPRNVLVDCAGCTAVSVSGNTIAPENSATQQLYQT